MQRAIYDGQRAYSPTSACGRSTATSTSARSATPTACGRATSTPASPAWPASARACSAPSTWARCSGAWTAAASPTARRRRRTTRAGSSSARSRRSSACTATPARSASRGCTARSPRRPPPTRSACATALIPYIYSYEDTRRHTGVGLVRPLLFDWPNDPQGAQRRRQLDVRRLPAGVAGGRSRARPRKDIYLPAGRWTDWFSGKTYAGGQTRAPGGRREALGRHPAVRARGRDHPDPAGDGLRRPAPGDRRSTVEMFPAGQRTTFDYYDDDGSTYDYEHGAYYRQPLSRAAHAPAACGSEIGAVAGSYAAGAEVLPVQGARRRAPAWSAATARHCRTSTTSTHSTPPAARAGPAAPIDSARSPMSG